MAFDQNHLVTTIPDYGSSNDSYIYSSMNSACDAFLLLAETVPTKNVTC